MAWLWLLFPLLLLALTLLLWRAVATLRRERAGLQAEVDALAPLAERARQGPQPISPRPAAGQEQVDR